jgi:hypothetical protein
MGLVSAFNAVHNDSSRRDKSFVTINYVGFLLFFWLGRDREQDVVILGKLLRSRGPNLCSD